MPALAMLVLLAGCTALPGGEPGGTAAPPPVPTDPVVAFASTATPGQQGSVTLADGRPAQVQLVRSYFAASGRECREVMVGAGISQRVQVACAGEDGAWSLARSLLPGGAARR
jgi:hypothetical protein